MGRNEDWSERSGVRNGGSSPVLTEGAAFRCKRKIDTTAKKPTMNTALTRLVTRSAVFFISLINWVFPRCRK